MHPMKCKVLNEHQSPTYTNGLLGKKNATEEKKKPKLLLWKKSTLFFHISKGRREKIRGKKIRFNTELKKSLKSFRYFRTVKCYSSFALSNYATKNTVGNTKM